MKFPITESKVKDLTFQQMCATLLSVLVIQCFYTSTENYYSVPNGIQILKINSAIGPMALVFKYSSTAIRFRFSKPYLDTAIQKRFCRHDFNQFNQKFDKSN